ncbi:MAG: hypothetical protein M1299_06720 [Firmicutes bacterium]|nr:hypothetical protein [Bacillota bacterium]MCL5039501.1 hypothetical protein [Bacillota bacterium]
MDPLELKAAVLDEEEIEQLREVEKSLNSTRLTNGKRDEIFLLAVTREGSKEYK